MRERDTGRSHTYAAEQVIERLLTDGGKVDFHGSTLDVPKVEPIATLQRCQWLVNMAWTVGGGAQGQQPTVVKSRGIARAYYKPDNHSIYLPDNSFGRSVMTVLHETAHALVREGRSHGPEFQKMLVHLVKMFVSPEASLLLMDAFRLEAV